MACCTAIARELLREQSADDGRAEHGGEHEREQAEAEQQPQRGLHLALVRMQPRRRNAHFAHGMAGGLQPFRDADRAGARIVSTSAAPSQRSSSHSGFTAMPRAAAFANVVHA